MTDRPRDNGPGPWVAVRRIGLLLAALVVVTVGLVLVNQTLQLAALAAGVHPWAGRVVLWGLVLTYLLCGGVPLYLWLRLPPRLVPPASVDDPGFDEHLRQLGNRLATNPHLAPAPVETLEEIERALSRLDARADTLIRETGGRVFLTTAISQFGALDAVMVLALQTRLVWDVAQVYAQRPSPRDLVTLYANVLGTAFVAGELEEAELSEYVQPVIASLLGSATSVVPGLAVTSGILVQSVVSGAANAFLALRIGILAQQFSRGLVRPARSTLRLQATARAARMLGSITAAGASTVSAAIARASHRTVSNAVTGLGRKMKEAGSVALGPFSRGPSAPGSRK